MKIISHFNDLNKIKKKLSEAGNFRLRKDYSLAEKCRSGKLF